jgi:hypothetical protein
MRKLWILGCLVLPLACTSASHSGGNPAGGGAGGSSTGDGGTAGVSSAGGATGLGGSSIAGKTGTGGVATTGRGGAGTATGRGGGTATGHGGSTGTAGVVGTSAGVLERNNHPSRDAHFLQPTLTREAAARMALDETFTATYSGAVLGAPLYFPNGPGGTGIFVVATSGNDVYAFDETSGAMVWTKNLGSPAAKSGTTGCDGNNPLGVISTPIIDAKSSTLYLAGAIGDANGITSHSVWAVSLMDGSIKAGYPTDVSKALSFDPTTHNQRGALSMVGQIVYVPYGGHTGDCVVDVRGRVVAIDTSTSPPTVSGWQSAGQGEAIWAPAGMASAGDGVFAVTGNRLTTTGDHTDSEEIIHVRGKATLDKKTGSKDFFFPSDWKTKDMRDFDLGSVNPILINLPGSTGPALVVISKDGNGFILDSADLGKGPLVTFDVAMQGMNVRSVPTAYVSGSTTFYAIAVDGAWAGCPTGTVNGSVIMGFALAPSLPAKPAVTWCAAYSLVPKGTDEAMFRGAPAAPGLISTTTDGSADAMLWYMNGGNQLVAIDGANGAPVFKDVAGACGLVRKWTSPIAVKGRIIVAADGKLCSWSPH